MKMVKTSQIAKNEKNAESDGSSDRFPEGYVPAIINHKYNFCTKFEILPENENEAKNHIL